ncbi:MAG TPA: hypothetical protein VGO47_02210 [Chlamydiales bacterium]|nr:hypothetical protein [Chlamydiales bacterium]
MSRPPESVRADFQMQTNAHAALSSRRGRQLPSFRIWTTIGYGHYHRHNLCETQPALLRHKDRRCKLCLPKAQPGSKLAVTTNNHSEESVESRHKDINSWDGNRTSLGTE